MERRSRSPRKGNGRADTRAQHSGVKPMPYGHPDDPAAAEAKVIAELSGVSPDDKDKGAVGDLLNKDNKSNPNGLAPLNIKNETMSDLAVQHLPNLSPEES